MGMSVNEDYIGSLRGLCLSGALCRGFWRADYAWRCGIEGCVWMMLCVILCDIGMGRAWDGRVRFGTVARFRGKRTGEKYLLEVSHAEIEERQHVP